MPRSAYPIHCIATRYLIFYYGQHLTGTREESESRDALARMAHNLSSNEQLLFLEIDRVDSSEFEASLRVTGVCVGRYKILCASRPAVPNVIAAIMIHMRHATGRLPHVYFKWTEGNPIAQMFRFLVSGEGDVPPVTHEVLRRSIADRISGRLCI